MEINVGVRLIVMRKSMPSFTRPIEYIDERNVCLGDRLVQPVLFKELIMLRVSHIR